MQPGELRKFERPRRRRRHPGTAVPGEPAFAFPEEGRAVVLDRTFPCPCERCRVCGGTVEVTAILWYDEWPVGPPDAPDAPDGEGLPDYSPTENLCHTLHLSVAPKHLDKQKACSRGCEIAPEEWGVVEASAFLDLCRGYAKRAAEFAAAVKKATEDGA